MNGFIVRVNEKKAHKSTNQQRNMHAECLKLDPTHLVNALGNLADPFFMSCYCTLKFANSTVTGKMINENPLAI
jgi:hypothetical protein